MLLVSSKHPAHYLQEEEEDGKLVRNAEAKKGIYIRKPERSHPQSKPQNRVHQTKNWKHIYECSFSSMGVSQLLRREADASATAWAQTLSLAFTSLGSSPASNKKKYKCTHLATQEQHYTSKAWIYKTSIKLYISYASFLFQC